MSDIKSLEREIELLKELIELKAKLLEIEKSYLGPTHPAYPVWTAPYYWTHSPSTGGAMPGSGGFKVW